MDVNSIDNYNSLVTNQKQIILNWCLSLVKIKTINKKHTSYGLKHKFEESSQGFYVTNGAFKGAMIAAGFKTQEHDSVINLCFNVSEKSIKDLN